MLLAPRDMGIVPSYTHFMRNVNTQKYAYMYIMAFLCIIYVHNYNLCSNKDCLSGWGIYFHRLLFAFFHLSLFNKHRELDVYLICGTKEMKDKSFLKLSL